MSELATPKSDALEQARAKALRLAGSFEAVFGQPRTRTAPQKAVLEHLATCAGDDGNSYRFNDAKDGLALIAAGIHRDGARSLLRVIERQLQIAGNVRAPKKDKPATKR
jgi:hypothetical protein